jgi:hypothetical protein
MIKKIIQMGWNIVELVFVLILLCLAVGIVLGPDQSGSFIRGVSDNALGFLREVPAGIILALSISVGLYWLIKKRA